MQDVSLCDNKTQHYEKFGMPMQFHNVIYLSKFPIASIFHIIYQAKSREPA